MAKTKNASSRGKRTQNLAKSAETSKGHHSQPLEFMEAELEYYKSRCAELTSAMQNQSNLLGLPTLHGIVFVCVTDIVYCQGESSQTSIYLVDHKRHLVNRTLKECEEALEKFSFCRIHKSYLINLQHIRKFNRGEGRSVDLSDGTHLEVTVSYKEKLLSRVNRL